MNPVKALLLGLLIPGLLGAQGMLPPAGENPTSVPGTIGIGEKTPETLSLVDASGKVRTLLSYKSPLDVMVIVFLSDSCEANTEFWKEIPRVTSRYEGWKVAWLSVVAKPFETTDALRHHFQNRKVDIPVATDPEQKAAKAFRVTQSPTVAILDESGVLRYRGPLSEMKKALDATINHIDTIAQPEPAMGPGCPL